MSDAQIHLHRHDLFTAAGVDSYMRGPSDNSAPLRVLGRDDMLAARRPRLAHDLGKEFRVDRVLEDGDRIDLGFGTLFSMVHTPGHTLGHVSFFWSQHRCCSVGTPFKAWRVDCPANSFASPYKASVRRVMDMPVETLCMAHAFEWSRAINLPIRRGDEVQQTLEDSLAIADRIGDTVKSIMSKNADIGLVELAWAVLDCAGPSRCSSSSASSALSRTS